MTKIFRLQSKRRAIIGRCRNKTRKKQSIIRYMVAICNTQRIVYELVVRGCNIVSRWKKKTRNWRMQRHFTHISSGKSVCLASLPLMKIVISPLSTAYNILWTTMYNFRKVFDCINLNMIVLCRHPLAMKEVRPQVFVCILVPIRHCMAQLICFALLQNRRNNSQKKVMYWKWNCYTKRFKAFRHTINFRIPCKRAILWG